MKNKLFIFITALLASLVACFMVACDNDPPSNDSPPPEYTTITAEQFSTAMQGVGAIENYLNVLGYKFDINVTIEDALVATETDLSVILDMSVLEDVSVSVCLDNKTTTAVSGQQATTQTELNLYLYAKTLYVDYTVDGVTTKDSMPNVNNDITELLSQFITDASSMDSIDMGEVDTSQLDELTEYFKDYLDIFYCAELGHYVLDVDYSAGGTYQGETIDPFTSKTDIYVKNGRVTTVSLDFDSADIDFTIALAEHSGTILYPENPTSYQGELLDMFEFIYDNRNISENEFYGNWISEDDDVTLNISQQSVCIDGETVDTYTNFYSYSVLMMLKDKYLLVLYPDEYAIVCINLSNGETDVFFKHEQEA